MRRVQPIWTALAGDPLLRWGAGPDVVARHARGGLVYLASPVTCRFEGAARASWADDRVALDILLQECGLDLAALAEAGVTAVSPVVQSLSMVAARGESLRRDPWGVLDAERWQAWCWPMLARCSAVYVPARSGWWASAGIAAEVREALGRNVQVFVQAAKVPALGSAEGGVLMSDADIFHADLDLAGLDMGASAKSIMAWFAGHGAQRGDYPFDADDFGRCEALLERFPDWRDSLEDMDKLNAYWAELSRAWPQLRKKKAEALTKAIRAVIDPIHAVDPAYIGLMPGAAMRIGSEVRFSHREYLEALARREAKPKPKGGSTPAKQPEACPTANLASLAREAAGDVARQSGKPPLKPDPEFDAMATDAYNVTADELRSFIERYERLEAEKADIAGQQKEVMAEAKGRGYDAKVLRRVIALRKRKPDEVAEEEAVLEVYKAALGMV